MLLSPHKEVVQTFFFSVSVVAQVQKKKKKNLASGFNLTSFLVRCGCILCLAFARLSSLIQVERMHHYISILSDQS